jgi:hypothetical protein
MGEEIFEATAATHWPQTWGSWDQVNFQRELDWPKMNSTDHIVGMKQAGDVRWIHFISSLRHYSWTTQLRNSDIYTQCRQNSEDAQSNTLQRRCHMQ